MGWDSGTMPAVDDVLRGLAANPGLPVEVIVELLGHEDGEVVEAAASNPSLPVEVMLRLLA
ncbi:hypothetical protein DF268_11355 [Streptomyces sp. V2]|nr:hypothetical protein DF268_11355 [Streptomyces sp. V2]